MAESFSPKKNTGLGKGLGALISSAELNADGTLKDELKSAINEIAVHLIRSNPYQPRKEFDPQALEELKNSIVETGLVQPISVRKNGNIYELIAGERRYRACKLAGWDKIPAYVHQDVSDESMLEMALIENVQREKLNAIELAEGYQQLIDVCRLTQDDVARKIGKDRTTITNIIRLLKLPGEIQDSLKKEEISIGHGRSLLALPSEKWQLKIWQQVKDQSLSVRKTEQTVAKTLKDIEAKKTGGAGHVTAPVNPHIADIENRLRMKLGTKVKMTPSGKGGLISIEYYSHDDLDRLLELFDQIRD